MTLSIIIVSYNTKDLTLQAIESAWKDAQQSSTLRGKTEIIVVDNNSTDDTVTEIQNKFSSKNIRVIKNDHNSGFAQANNQGIAMATGKYILLLNSDVIVQKNALVNLINTMEEFEIDDSTSTLSSQRHRLDRLGMLAATLLNEDGTLQPQGGSLPTLASLFFHMTFLDDIPLIGRCLPSTQHTGFHKTEQHRYQTQDSRLIQRGWVAATAVLLRQQMLDEIGVLDENIFMYGEDVELCMRAQNHHWDIAIHPQARVTHLGSASSSSENALKGELLSYVYIWSKHKPLWQLPLVKTFIKIGCHLRIGLFRTVTPNPNKVNAYQQVLKQL